MGDKLLFREGRTKGLGIVKELGYDKDKPLNASNKDGATSKDANGKA